MACDRFQTTAIDGSVRGPRTDYREESKGYPLNGRWWCGPQPISQLPESCRVDAPCSTWSQSESVHISWSCLTCPALLVPEVRLGGVSNLQSTRKGNELGSREERQRAKRGYHLKKASDRRALHAARHRSAVNLLKWEMVNPRLKYLSRSAGPCLGDIERSCNRDAGPDGAIWVHWQVPSNYPTIDFFPLVLSAGLALLDDEGDSGVHGEVGPLPGADREREPIDCPNRVSQCESLCPMPGRQTSIGLGRGG